jgi:hypothetical protein
MISDLKQFVLKQFGTEQYEVRGSFPMLHAGWECDDVVMMIAVNEQVHAVGTNHGSPVLLSKQDLLDKVAEYKEVLDATLSAAEYLD